jgi:5-carboxymethyl-2-hydroxymuconate isomerase
VKLLSFEVGGRASFGAAVDGGVVDFGPRLGEAFPDLAALFARDGLAAARQAARETIDYALADVTLLPPIPAPEKIFCIGVNYRNRNEEYRDDSAAPSYPSVFMRTPGSLVGHGTPIVRPPESAQLDYEGEIAIVIGTGGRRIPQDAANGHVAGLTAMNEGTIRDWVRHGKFNVTQGKNFARSGAAGPWLVTTDEFDGFDNLHVTTRVNGEVRQHDTTANLSFPFAYLISYLSTFAELRPGDVIATGTPVGAGARFDPPRYLVPGDVVDVEAEGVGTLSNPIADEFTNGAAP